MKQAAICAFLAMLWHPKAVFCDSKAQSTVPWVIYTSGHSQFLNAEIKGKSNTYQQHIGYLGTTFKPLNFAWFHGGLKSKWTQTENLSDLYGEPAVLYIASGFSIIKKYLYASAGLRLPLSEQSLPLSDSLEVSNFSNQFNLAAEPNILPLNKVQIGMYSGFDIKDLKLKLGFSYLKPAAYEMFEANSQFPGSYLSYKLKGGYIYKGLSHNLILNLLSFTEELDRSYKDEPAHKEGDIWQGMYQLKIHSGPGAMELDLGMAYQQKDENRTQLGLDSRMRTEKTNSNIQRYFISFSWIRPLFKGSPLTISLSPQLLTRQSDDALGYQSHVTSQLKFKAGKANIFRIAFNGKFGSIGEEQIFGAGAKLMYSFYGTKYFSARLFPQRVE